MKKILIVLLLIIIHHHSNAQFGSSIHQSNLPFVGINYGIGERLLPELRIGTDNFFDDTSLELTLNYIFFKDEIVNAYAGIGGRIQILEGLVLPLGLNIYPFENKKFGFQMELAGLLGRGESDGGALLRGSWGIRYRFIK